MNLPITPSHPVRFLHVFPGYGLGGAELRVTRTINQVGGQIGGQVDRAQQHAILSINGNVDAARYLRPDMTVPIITGPPKNGAVKFPRALWRTIQTVKPAVILTYNWGATDAIIGAMLSRFRPIIHNECGLSADIDGKGWRRRWARRLLLPRCHRVVVTSHTLHDMALDDFRVPEKKVVFIKTGVDTQRFTPGTDQAMRALIGPGPQGVVFGYVGSLRPSKNLPMLLHAFADARRPEDRLALFGAGPERERLESLATELGIRDALYMHGHIASPVQAFQAIDVNVTTSKSEAASNSLLESMACGLPTVSTDIADNRKILSDPNRRFVYSHDDLEGFASGLRAMAKNPHLRDALGSINRQRACSEYPVDRMFREYAELWNDTALCYASPS